MKTVVYTSPEVRLVCTDYSGSLLTTSSDVSASSSLEDFVEGSDNIVW